MNHATQNAIPGLFKASAIGTLHLLVFLIIGIGLGYLSIASFDIKDWEISKQFLQVLLFVGAGILNVVIIHDRRRAFDYANFKNGLLFSLLITVALVIELSIFYSVTDVSKAPTSISCGLSFLLPYMVYWSWKYYSAIPRLENKVWYSEEKDWGDIISLNTITVTLKLRKKYFSLNEQSFTRIAAGRVPLGRMFHHFLKEQNYNNAANIEVLDEHGNSFGWKFHSAFLGGVIKKPLDPNAPLIVNHIKDKSIIHATRVRTE